MRGISWLAENRLGSKERLCSVEYVTFETMWQTFKKFGTEIFRRVRKIANNDYWLRHVCLSENTPKTHNILQKDKSFHGNRDTLVATVTRLQAGRSDIRTPAETKLFFFLLRTCRRVLGPTQPPIQWVMGLSFGCNATQREGNHSPPSSAKDKMSGSIPSYCVSYKPSQRGLQRT
jgi:hypothetical protein